MMKLAIKYLSFVLLGGILSAQEQHLDRINVGSGNYELRSSQAALEGVGSPYINKDYLPSTVTGYQHALNLKYNAYTDQMEFESDGKVYGMNREAYPEVFMGPSKTRYVSLAYTDGKKINNGFLRVVAENPKVGFYVKETVGFTPASYDENGYTSAKPATYKRAKDRYFVKAGDAIVEMPSNKKKFVALFPGKESQISDFISEQKISLDNETGMAQLAGFINSL